MNKKCMLIILFLLMAGFSLLRAQESLTLSLGEAQQYAIEYNKILKNAGLAVDAADEQYMEYLSAGLPQVNAILDYKNYLGAEIEINFQEGMPPTKIPFKPTSNLTLTLGQLIFSGDYVVGLQLANLSRDLTKSNLEKTELDIKEQVANSYYTILVAEESLNLIEQNLANIRDVRNKTNAMYSAGMAEITDVDQLSVQVTMLENAVKSAERQVQLAYNLFRLQLGVNADKEIILTDNMDDIIASINFISTLNESFELQDNIDYQMMSTQELMSRKQFDLEKMSFIPSITGFYSRTQKILRPDFDMIPPNLIGLQMNVPIFSSGMRKSKLDRAKINYEAARNSKELLTDQLLIQERQLRFNLNTALEQYESQKNNVEVSKRVYNNLYLKYEQGLVSSLDITTANNIYLQAETNYVTALMQLLNANLALDKLLNNL